MADAEPLIRNVSDTAYWVALYRAREHDRPNALFRDPFARRLAGERGRLIAESMTGVDRHEWAYVIRTYLYDSFVTEQIATGVDAVINLAAGLDTRPYRMDLPASLTWVEVDYAEVLAYKESVLGDAKPVCALEHVAMDLADVGARRELFQRVGALARNVLIVTEGLLIYLSEEEVGTLATDLAAPPSFHHWIIDLASPGLLKMIQGITKTHLNESTAPLKFAPKEGPPFFARFGWRPAEVRSMLKAAARVKRVPLLMRIIAKLPSSNGAQGRRPWSAICRLERQ